MPGWITRLLKKREAQKTNPRHFEYQEGRRGGGGGIATGKRRQFSPQGQSKKVMNGADMKQCKLVPNEKYRELFHPGNLKGVLKPKRNNELLCLRFHTLGYCYPDCKYRSGHGVLSQEEEKQMKEFMHEARRNLQAFQNRKKNIPKEKENDTNSVSLTSNTGE